MTSERAHSLGRSWKFLEALLMLLLAGATILVVTGVATEITIPVMLGLLFANLLLSNRETLRAKFISR